MVQQTKHSVTEKHVPVLITGAGAAGLSHVANAAAARHSFVTDWTPPRCFVGAAARNLNFRTLEVFRALGLDANGRSWFYRPWLIVPQSIKVLMKKVFHPDPYLLTIMLCYPMITFIARNHSLSVSVPLSFSLTLKIFDCWGDDQWNWMIEPIALRPNAILPGLKNSNFSGSTRAGTLG